MLFVTEEATMSQGRLTMRLLESVKRFTVVTLLSIFMTLHEPLQLIESFCQTLFEGICELLHQYSTKDFHTQQSNSSWI